MGHLSIVVEPSRRVTFASAIRQHPDRWSLPTIAVALSVGGRRTMRAWLESTDKLDRALLGVAETARRTGPIRTRARINRSIAKI